MRFTALSRAVTSVAVALVVASPSLAPADAAPSRTCRLLRDTADDDGVGGGVLVGTPLALHDEALDIQSADVATDSTRLTAVIRVAGLAGATAPTTHGWRWSFHFATDEAAFFVDARRSWSGDKFGAHVYTSEYSGDTSQSFTYTPLGAVSGVVDAATGEVRITAPLALFAPHDRIAPGTSLKKLMAISWFSHTYEDWGNNSESDEVVGGSRTTYDAGTKTCVTVGS